MTQRYRDLNSPIGPLRLLANDTHFTGLALPFRRRNGVLQPLAAAEPDWQHHADLLPSVAEQLNAYFAGERQVFDLEAFELPCAFHGTEFQRKVWQALIRIPYGNTYSYGDIARHIGRPNAVRAVGAANGANPIPIIVPCHRVIAANGALHGFGGGLELKQRLLQLEQDQHQGFMLT